MNEEYYVGLEFIADDDYSNKATWCNDNDCHIESIGLVDEVEHFVIVKNPELSEEELARFDIEELKRRLSETDYMAIKYAEGVLSEEEYSPMKIQRESWRIQIRNLESKFNFE